MGSLCIMIGLPCSGKDTIANIIRNNNLGNTIILSSDEIRVELFGYENQKDNQKVFQEMNRRCKECLSRGLNVIYNATNLSRKRRKALILEMKKHTNELYAVICLSMIGTILERNFVRNERHVPEDKLIQMFKNIDVPLKYEGYNKIYIVNTDNINDSTKMVEWLKAIGTNYDQKNEYHNEYLLDHLLTTADKAFDKSGDKILYEAGRFHDIGKPYSREWNEKKNKYTYYQHYKISAYLYLLYYTYANKIENIIEMPNALNEVITLIYHHMDKFIKDLDETRNLIGEDLFKKLEILIEADSYRKGENVNEE